MESAYPPTPLTGPEDCGISARKLSLTPVGQTRWALILASSYSITKLFVSDRICMKLYAWFWPYLFLKIFNNNWLYSIKLRHITIYNENSNCCQGLQRKNNLFKIEWCKKKKCLNVFFFHWNQNQCNVSIKKTTTTTLYLTLSYFKNQPETNKTQTVI